MRRLREISLFDCDVRVLRNGFCRLLLDFPIRHHIHANSQSQLQGDLFPPRIWYLEMSLNSLIPH